MNESKKVKKIREEATISFEIKSGLFRISEYGCMMLGLEEGERIEFLQDPVKYENWFIVRSKTTGFELRKKESVTSGLYFNCMALAQLLLSSAASYNLPSGKVTIRSVSLRYKGRIVWSLDLSPLKVLQSEAVAV